MKVYTYHVRPRLPEALEPLRKLAMDYWFSWNWQAVQLFIRMDPVLWEDCYQNPIEMLARMPQERLEELARDDSFLANLRRVDEMFEIYRRQSTWFDKFHPTDTPPIIAYFSCEYGIAEGLPIYSGGLGILSGDHLKSCSDLGIPLVAVGLLYQEGYFRQYLNNDGWQQERYPENDWHNMSVQLERDEAGEPIRIQCEMADETVHAQIWRAQVGMTPLYLLDTNIPENSERARSITRRLYGGDRETRIRQELILGVGGVRALRALGKTPSVYHMNEGHSAFLALERLRFLLKEKGLTYREACEHVWATNVFTTHTPVPAGNERFSTDLVRKYLAPLAGDLGLEWRDFLGLGRVSPSDDREDFCMTVLALKLSAFNNGVAKLHGVVSRQMWRDLWPDLPVEEVPIGHITNGIHTLSWISHDLRELLVSYLGPKLTEQPWDLTVWDRVDSIPDVEYWRTHQRRRERLVFFSRKRLAEQLERRGVGREAIEHAQSVLDPHALTIGFARRFATYKRCDMLFYDPDRLHRLIADADRPVQFVFAGKAHPADTPGKEMIKRIVHFAAEERFRSNVVFLEDYDINVARYLLQGVDVWLNTPRRPLEASGTSGMKAASNGALNVSVLDGWWDEAYGPETRLTGWAIGGGEEYKDQKFQDWIESQALYDVLEREVIPLFYERDRTGLPRDWIQRSKSCLRLLARQFNTHRMLMDYTESLYLPAIAAHTALETEGCRLSKELAAWREHVEGAWSQVAIQGVEVENDHNRLLSGEKLVVRVLARLGPLSVQDVAVQVCHGPMDARGKIVDSRIAETKPIGERDGVHAFECHIDCRESGRRGFAARIIPAHEHLVHPFMRSTVRWEAD